MNNLFNFILEPSLRTDPDLVAIGLASFIVKICLVCAAAQLFSVCLRNQSARVRHQLFLGAFGLLVLIPVAHFFSVGWPLELPLTDARPAVASLPGPPELTVKEPEVESSLATTLPEIELSTPRALDSETETNAQENPAADFPNTEITQVASSIPSQSIWHWLNLKTLWPILFTIWVLGSFLHWTRLTIAWIEMQLTVSRAAKNDSARLDLLLTDCRDRICCHRRIDLRTLDNRTIPLVTGIYHPVILFPRESTTWTIEQLRAALMHELAHVVRRDCLTNWLVQLTMGFYWWHPLVGMLRKQLEAEREQASDELVVSHLKNPADYAEHLVSVVRQTQVCAAPMTVAMARSSNLTKRVQNILAFSPNRVASSFLGRASVAVFLTALIPLALIQAKTSEPAVAVNRAQDESLEDDENHETTTPRETQSEIESWMSKYEITKGQLDYLEGNQGPPIAKLISRSGRVVDQEGNPVSGADVYLRLRMPLFHRSDGKDKLVVAETKTDANGLFEFVDEPSPPIYSNSEPLIVFVSAPGFGFEWQSLDMNLPHEDFEFKLASDIPISGAVLGPSAEPVPDASVYVYYTTPTDNAQDLQSRREKQLAFMAGDMAFGTRSDETGRFTIRGMPSDQLCLLKTKHSDFVQNEGDWVTNSMTPLRPDNNGGQATRGRLTLPPVQSEDIKIQLVKGRRVAGQVIYADTGQPAASLQGRIIFSSAMTETNQFETDKNGRFESDNFCETEIAFLVQAPEGSNYIRAFHVETFSNEDEIQPVTIRIPRGESIRGTLKNSEGKPANGALVYFEGRPFEFTRALSNTFTGKTNEKGEFEIQVEPGEGTIIAAGQAPGFQLPSTRMVSTRRLRPAYAKRINEKPITVVAGETHPPIDLVAPASIQFSSQIVGTDGKPVAGAEIKLVKGEGVLDRDGYSNRLRHYAATTDKNGRFEIDDVPHDSQATFTITHVGTRRSIVIVINAPSDVPPQIPLLKCGVIEGQVTMDDRPIQGVSVRLHLELTSTPIGNGGNSVTSYNHATRESDENGNYVFYVPAGHKPYLNVSVDKYDSLDHISSVTPTPGQTVKIPTFKFESLPELVSGVVNDPEGNPLPNVEISIHTLERGEIRRSYSKDYNSRGYRSPISDKEGKFTVRFLPANKEVRVSARLTDENGRTLTRTSITAMTGNQDLRLIIDPKLAQARPKKR